LSSIGVEKDFSKKIEKEIHAADFVILLIGPDWFDSFERREDDDRPDWVLFEVQTALADNKKIVPILLDGTECPDWTTARGLAPLAKVPAHPLSTGLDYGVHLEKIVGHIAKALSDERANKRWWEKVYKRGPLKANAVLQPPATDLKPLRLLVVMGENTPYEKALVKGLEDTLKQELPAHGLTPKIIVIDTPLKDRYASPTDPKATEVWNRLIERAKVGYDGERIDYIVSVATFASEAVRDGKLRTALEARGHIYMGVTSPQRAGLTGLDCTAGVQYGTGGADYGRMFHKLFPAEQRLVFIYNGEGYPQDLGVAKDLSALNDELAPQLGGRPRFELQELGRMMQPDDLELADPKSPLTSPVYMAWYDLDNMISEMVAKAHPLIFKPELWVVPTTYTLENMNYFGAVVGVDDEAGGKKAAHLILEHLEVPSKNLKSCKMRYHGYRATLKDRVLLRKGLQIDPAVRSSEDRQIKFETSEL